MKYFVYSYQWKKDGDRGVFWATGLSKSSKGITGVYEKLIEMRGYDCNVAHIQEISKKEFFEAEDRGIIG